MIDEKTIERRMWWMLVYLSSCADYIKENNRSLYMESGLDQYEKELGEVIQEYSDANRQVVLPVVQGRIIDLNHLTEEKK